MTKTQVKLHLNGLMNDFVKKVRQELRAQDMSVVELAEVAGVSREYIYEVFRGECCPTVDWVEKVAKVLGLKLTLEKSR
jgi:DNA-binding phage protein